MRRTGPDKATIAGVGVRDGHCCIRCGSTRDLQLHHRRPRASGGTVRPDANSCVNLLTVCSECHQRIESNRTEALDNGWLVRQNADPAQVPVLIHHQDGAEWFRLTEDFGYAYASPVGAA